MRWSQILALSAGASLTLGVLYDTCAVCLYNVQSCDFPSGDNDAANRCLCQRLSQQAGCYATHNDCASDQGPEIANAAQLYCRLVPPSQQVITTVVTNNQVVPAAGPRPNYGAAGLLSISSTSQRFSQWTLLVCLATAALLW